MGTFHVLDDEVELDTFALTEIAFADQRIAIPDGTANYSTSVPINANGVDVLVEVSAELDRRRGFLR